MALAQCENSPSVRFCSTRMIPASCSADRCSLFCPPWMKTGRAMCPMWSILAARSVWVLTFFCHMALPIVQSVSAFFPSIRFWHRCTVEAKIVVVRNFIVGPLCNRNLDCLTFAPKNSPVAGAGGSFFGFSSLGGVRPHRHEPEFRDAPAGLARSSRPPFPVQMAW